MFIFENPFHIKKINLLHGVFLSIAYLRKFIVWLILTFMMKSIRDNYRIYGLIIVKIAKESLVLDYGLLNATFETPNHAFV
jgi:hypothetical protein